MSPDLKKAQKIHFVGIGGIGISAIARMMLEEGKSVSGSDRGESKVTEELAKAGVKISIPQRAENVPDDCDLVVYTVAIPDDNPELVRARERKMPLMTYPQTLDEISKERYTIAVSGTHGKTTVTAMIAKIMLDAGLDPTVIVGSLMKLPDGRESNYIAGRSKYLVVEADEYKKSFHNLHPTVLVINNLDLDHLDFYKDLADIQESFREVALKVPADGAVIADVHNPNVMPVLEGVSGKVVDYAEYLKQPIELQIPGAHNRSNAAAALAVANVLGVSNEKTLSSLKMFENTWRRFEFKGEMQNGALVYDDYAHNPQKVRAAIQGAQEAHPDKKIIAVFQPHLYSRTKTLFDDFVTAFHGAEAVILSKIYPAREEFDPSISSDMLAEALQKQGVAARAFDTLEKIENVIRAEYDSKDNLILIMGAGDITEVAGALVRAPA